MTSAQLVQVRIPDVEAIVGGTDEFVLVRTWKRPMFGLKRMYFDGKLEALSLPSPASIPVGADSGGAPVFVSSGGETPSVMADRFGGNSLVAGYTYITQGVYHMLIALKERSWTCQIEVNPRLGVSMDGSVVAMASWIDYPPTVTTYDKQASKTSPLQLADGSAAYLTSTQGGLGVSSNGLVAAVVDPGSTAKAALESVPRINTKHVPDSEARVDLVGLFRDGKLVRPLATVVCNDSDIHFPMPWGVWLTPDGKHCVLISEGSVVVVPIGHMEASIFAETAIRGSNTADTPVFAG